MDRIDHDPGFGGARGVGASLEQILFEQADKGGEIAFGQLVERCYIQVLQVSFALYGRLLVAKDRAAFVFASTRSQLATCRGFQQYEQLLLRALIREYLRTNRFWDGGGQTIPCAKDLLRPWFPLTPVDWLEPWPSITDVEGGATGERSYQLQLAIRTALAPLAGLPRVTWLLLRVLRFPMHQACQLTGCFVWQLRRALGQANRQLGKAREGQGVGQQVGEAVVPDHFNVAP